MSQDTIQFKHSIILLIWMILSQLLAIASLIWWFLLVMSPGMIFAGESGGGIFLFVFFLYPIFPITMIICAWVAYLSNKKWLAAILSGLSIAPNMLLILV